MDPDTLTNLIMFITVALLLLYFKNYFRAVSVALTQPGPFSYPIIGNALTVNDHKKLLELGTTGYKWFGVIQRCWVSIIPFFLIMDPQHLQILIGNNKVTEKNLLYKLMHNFLGEGLITNNGSKWRKNRKFIQPYFHINVLKTFINIFAEGSMSLLDKLKENEDFNITKVINDGILDILHKAVLGISIDETNLDSPFRKGQVILTYRITRPWMLLDSVFKLTKFARIELNQKSNLQNFARKVLEDKRKEPKNKMISDPSVLDMFMEISENNPDFTDEDIVNESCTFMLAGQDSVGAAVAFSIYYLAKYQDIQDKVISEQNEIFEKDSRPATFDDLNEMKYLEQCVKETLRLSPSVPIISRRLTEDVTLGKVTLPIGCNVLISPFATHRLDYVYPDPLKYDPERFSAKNIEKIHPFAFIPFSAGPRNCIGYKFALLEIKSVLSTILRNYRISLTPGHEELNVAYRITLRAKGGIWVKLTKRHFEEKVSC